MRSALLTLGLLSVALPGAAQMPTEGSATEARQLETVTVRASRSIAQRFFAPGSLVTVDRQDIEQMGADSVGDVLRQLPGVQVNSSGNGNLEIRMRGMDRSATQILIDGEKVSGSRQSAQLPFDQLPADMIERIEVLRAPSAEFAGATGGTINIVLRQASVQRETNIRLTDQRVWGQNAFQGFFSKTGPVSGEDRTPKTAEAQPGTEAPLAPLAPPAQPWAYFLAGSVSDRLTGSNIHRDVAVTGANASTAQSDEKYRFRTNEWLLIPRLSGRLSAADQVTVRSLLLGNRVKGQFDSAGQGVNSTGLSAGPTASSVGDATASERSLYQLRGDWTHRFKGSRLESYLSGQSGSEKIDRNRAQLLTNNLGSLNTLSTFMDNRTERAVTLSTKLTGTVDPLLWMLGAEVEERRLGVDTASSVGLGATPALFGLSSRIRRSVVWGQNEWALPADTTLTAGLRLETFETRSEAGSGGGSGPVAVTTDQRRFLQPSLHTRTPVDENLQIRFNLARVSRNPALMDLIDRRIPSTGLNAPNNPDVAGNPSLRPQSSITFDGGFERKLGEQGALGLNLFVRQLTDVIARRVTDNGVGLWTQRPENVGNATVWGLEGDVKTAVVWPGALGWGRDWTASANASLLQSRMTSGDVVGQRIPGQARYLVNTSLSKPLSTKGGWFGGTTLTLNGAADLNSSATSTGRESAYASLDVYVGQVVPTWGYWRVTVYNISNTKRARERLDIDSTGRSTAEQSALWWTPRVFFTLGTRF